MTYWTVTRVLGRRSRRPCKGQGGEIVSAGSKIIEGAKEALSVAKGEIPAHSITYNGHRYISAREVGRLSSALLRIIARSNNGELGTSKVIDMRRIAEDALENQK